MSSMPSPKDMKAQPTKTTFDNFWDRVKIGYFGVFTSPHFDDMERGNWENAAISPEWGNAPKGDAKNQDTWPTNLWNQVSFNFNFGAKMNFVINPRFAIMLEHPKDMKQPETRDAVMLDDVLFGFQGVILSSDNKAFNLWTRLGVRLPTSKPNRNTGSAGAGTISHQNDIAYNATYDFNKTWQLGLQGQFRQWVIEDSYGFARFRIATAPFIQYTIDDVSRTLVYYDNIIETDRRGKPADDRDPVFKDKWQDLLLGYSRDITPKFNMMPYIACFIADRPVTDKSFWIGAWISYQIK
jgi:hypothetical protein